MPKLPATSFKYFYASKFAALGKSLDAGYFLGLDLGSSVFGMAAAVMPAWEAVPLPTKKSRLR